MLNKLNLILNTTVYELCAHYALFYNPTLSHINTLQATNENITIIYHTCLTVLTCFLEME